MILPHHSWFLTIFCFCETGTVGNTTTITQASPQAVDTDNVVYWICGPPVQGESIRRTLLKDPRLKTKNGRMTTSREQIFVLGVDDR